MHAMFTDSIPINFTVKDRGKSYFSHRFEVPVECWSEQAGLGFSHLRGDELLVDAELTSAGEHTWKGESHDPRGHRRSQSNVARYPFLYVVRLDDGESVYEREV